MMNKKLVSLLILSLCVISGNYVFGFNNPFLIQSSNPFLPWIYNPISGFYEQKTEEEIEKEFINSLDFYSDDSLQKFLDDNHPLSTNYEADVVAINSDFTSNQSFKFYLRKEVAEAFESMAWAFSNAFNYKARLTINSAWRSQAYQRKLLTTCSTGRCAKAGTSEHEAGLALDLGVNGGNIKAGSGKYYQWLIDNAHLYGFHNTYQKGIKIDGKIVEPWHWRYVGIDLATILHKHNQTFTEYFYENIENSDI